MARTSTPLDCGDSFPALAFETVGHGTISLPRFFADGWGIAVFYRAYW